jgi:hypothetical protein
MTLFDLVLLFLRYNFTKIPLNTRIIIMCNIFIAISHAKLALYLIVSGKT